MRVIRNRVVEEWNDRLSEVPTRRDDLPEIGHTRFLRQDMVLRKFNVILATKDTVGDWEEMPYYVYYTRLDSLDILNAPTVSPLPSQAFLVLESAFLVGGVNISRNAH
jgi:hypothetical protein